ncbi:MAG: hypothetical protein KDD06_28220, partial [Phaeodactylibacter sp.]|nr:hypothetical protein [Phaeodactylibacter sp.]
THVVQQGGGGDSAPKVQLSPATDLISQYTSYLNLQEGPLGAELLRRINRGETEIAHSVLDELGWTDRDDVSYEIMVRATDTNLNAWMGSGEGRRLLERLFDQLTQGSVGEEEQREASRILYIKSMHIPTSEIPTELSEIKVFPYRLPGLTVFHDAPIMAERAGGGSIRVEQPVRVLGTDEFRPETITLPTQVFINGIEIPENEIIGVKMYDLGGEIHFRPALYLIQLSNETDATVLQKILEVSAIGITLGAGSLASLGVEASMTARVLLWADRAAFVIGTLTSVINEHRGWIISTFGESGRTFLRYNNLLNQIVGWYGIVRTVYEIPNLIRNFRTSYQNWRTLAREMSEEITSPQSSIIDDIGRNTDDFFDNVTSIEQARSTRAAAEGASGRSSGGASVGSEGQATIYEFPSGTQATLGQGEGSPQILNRPSSPQVAQGGTQGNVRVLRPRQPVEASVSGNTALDINSLPESLPVVEPLPPVPEPISVPEQVPGQITTPGTAAPTAPGQSTGTMANIGTGLHVAPDPATATNPQQQTASQSDQEEDDNQAVRVELILPPPKAIHLGSYFGKLGFLQHSVTRPDRDTSQRTKWEQNVRNEMPLEVYYWGISLGLDEVDIFRPYWSADRNFSPQRRMQVDHLIEWQVRPLSGGQWIDEPWNFELLDASSNGSAGPRMRGNIRRQRESLAQRTGDSSWLTRDLTFNWVSAESPGIAFRWSFDEIVRGDHLLAYERLTGETKNEELFRYYMEQFAGG